MDKLPVPVIQVGFAAECPLTDCLRAALHAAKGLRIGVLFEHDGEEYVVQPAMSVDQVLEMADPILAASVREHLTHG